MEKLTHQEEGNVDHLAGEKWRDKRFFESDGRTEAALHDGRFYCEELGEKRIPDQ